jgi:hypothetical protein
MHWLAAVFWMLAGMVWTLVVAIFRFEAGAPFILQYRPSASITRANRPDRAGVDRNAELIWPVQIATNAP